jgi:acetate kinase
MRVLVLNAGSSSLKHALADPLTGRLESAGTQRWRHDASKARHAEAVRAVLDALEGTVEAVGHRVVHGGRRFTGPARVDQAVLAAIEALTPLAPLHNPIAVAGIRAAMEALPEVPQVASFDTAFHHTLGAAARTLPLPERWRARFGLRRYGFHGLNVRWCAQRAPELVGADASRRLVICHLGSGCSVTAVCDGRSVDTTMGFTPMDGVPMATRPGALDPGAVVHLLRQGVGLEELERGLEHESGVAGLASGRSEMAEVVRAAASGEADAALALEVFVRGVASGAAAMATALGGLDCLVFTGGIGEHAPVIRGAVAERLAHLGVALRARDELAGRDGDVGAERAPVRVLVIAAGEERIIGREVGETLGRI